MYHRHVPAHSAPTTDGVMSAPSVLVLLACAAALVGAGPPHSRTLRNAQHYMNVQLSDAAFKTACEFEIREDYDEHRVPSVIRQATCVAPEQRKSKACCHRSRHECVQLRDTVFVMRKGKEHRVEVDVGCACMSSEFITSRPIKIPSPGDGD